MSAVLAQHYADSVQRMCLLLRGWFRAGQCNIILAHIVHTPNHYLIILDGVPHGELIPLHLPSFSAFVRPLKQ